MRLMAPRIVENGERSTAREAEATRQMSLAIYLEGEDVEHASTVSGVGERGKIARVLLGLEMRTCCGGVGWG